MGLAPSGIGFVLHVRRFVLLASEYHHEADVGGNWLRLYFLACWFWVRFTRKVLERPCGKFDQWKVYIDIQNRDEDIAKWNWVRFVIVVSYLKVKMC